MYAVIDESTRDQADTEIASLKTRAKALGFIDEWLTGIGVDTDDAFPVIKTSIEWAIQDRRDAIEKYENPPPAWNQRETAP